MGTMIAGHHEIKEYEFLNHAFALHRKLATMYEQNGLKHHANDEWAKCSLLKLAIKRWRETWEFPDNADETTMCCPRHAGRFKEKKSEIVDRFSRILREHMGVSRKVAVEVADALVRGRDLSTLALQKGWDLDGTALAVGCEKIRRIGINPEYMKYVDELERLAQSLGIDAETFKQAIEFMDSEDELEEAV